jgi:hypothetical protein
VAVSVIVYPEPWGSSPTTNSIDCELPIVEEPVFEKPLVLLIVQSTLVISVPAGSDRARPTWPTPLVPSVGAAALVDVALVGDDEHAAGALAASKSAIPNVFLSIFMVSSFVVRYSVKLRVKKRGVTRRHPVRMQRREHLPYHPRRRQPVVKV